MLKIRIKPNEFFDDKNNQFYIFPEKEVELQLEHSLVSISKWEAKWHKSFLSSTDKTNEELIDYIKCMAVNSSIIDERVYNLLEEDQVNAISAYINDPMTATTFREDPTKGHLRKTKTSEVIYYQMVALGIPFECQKWHLNRLLTLIRVCSEKNQPAKKMSNKEIANRNRALNEARRAQLKSRG